MSSGECFNTLGISPGASEDAIKKAYHKLVKLHHPDLGGKAEMFMRIQKAYENLTDPASQRKHDDHSQSTSSTNSTSSKFWNSWDTDKTWWTSGASGRYSARDDYDADFDTQWRKFTDQRRREKVQDRRETRKTRREKTYNKPQVVDRVVLEVSPCNKRKVDDKSIWGEYVRISKYNGRACFMNNESKVFLFWSNRNKDWKISKSLKDHEDCIAFADRVHPTEECPFVVGAVGKWMQWRSKYKRYFPVSILAKESMSKPATKEDFKDWSVDELRQALSEINGLEGKLASCIEKEELVELAALYLKLTKPKISKSKDPPETSDIPFEHVHICSRQRHDGVVQAPPVLSESCTVHRNKVEKFNGKLEDVENWLLQHGDRRRMYGVYDHEKRFCFSLIWKDYTHWGRSTRSDF